MKTKDKDKFEGLPVNLGRLRFKLDPIKGPEFSGVDLSFNIICLEMMTLEDNYIAFLE